MQETCVPFKNPLGPCTIPSTCSEAAESQALLPEVDSHDFEVLDPHESPLLPSRFRLRSKYALLSLRALATAWKSLVNIVKPAYTSFKSLFIGCVSDSMEGACVVKAMST